MRTGRSAILNLGDDDDDDDDDDVFYLFLQKQSGDWEVGCSGAGLRPKCTEGTYVVYKGSDWISQGP